MPAKDIARLSEALAKAEARVAELECELERHNRDCGPAELAAVHPASLILNSITDAFVAVDRDFRYRWVNVEAERLLGMSSEQLVGRSMLELFPHVAGTVVDQQMRLALPTGTPTECENYDASSDRWFFNKIYPTTDGGLAIYWREITDRKRAQADLRRQAQVLDQVHDSIVITDLDGRITHWNHGAQQTFGYHADEVVGRHVSILHFEEDRARAADLLSGPLLHEGRLKTELRLKLKSGAECYMQLSLSLLRDEENRPYGTLGVSVDVTARKRAEQALRETEARYHSLVDAMPHIAYTTDPAGRTQMINRHWEHYSGCSSESCLDLDWLAWIHPEDAAAVIELWMKCVPSGSPFDTEYRLRNAAGEYRWHLSRAIPVRGADGTIAQWVGTLTDIHDRKTAEELLFASEERFRLAFQAVEGFVYDWDPRTGRVLRRGNLEKFLGVSVDEAEASADWWQKRIHPDDVPAASLNLMPSLESDKNSFETEFRIRHADGRWVYACDRGYIVRDEGGAPVRVVGSTHDITERKRLEDEVEQNTRRLKFQADILATIEDGVIAIDANHSITYFNDGAERMYGCSRADAIGKPLSAVYECKRVPPEDEQRSISEGENIHIRADGTPIFVSSTVSVLSPELGGGFVAVIRDITKRRRAEIALEKQAAQLAVANEDLLHFAYAVSHDLQAPLRTVTSYSQLLALTAKAKLDEQGTQFLMWIAEAGGRMTTMLRDLLQFATVAGSEATPVEMISLNAPVAAALENLRSTIEETQAVIVIDPLPEVLGDAHQFTQLFQNLIGNSLKYRKQGMPPRVHLSAEEKGYEWVISVEDDGIGFEPQYAMTIFGVFQRLHDVEIPGTGIGLAICKRIVERRGGKIWASSKPGEGATFSFSIPRDEAESNVFRAVSPIGRMEDLRAPAGPWLTESPVPDAPFDELFHTLNLAQAMVRQLDGTILIWTEGAKRLFGWSEREALWKPAHDLLQYGLTKPLPEIEAELQRNGEWTGEIQARKRDGSPLWLASHWALFRDGSGRPQSVIEVHNDITALKQAEAALLRSGAQRDVALRAGQMGVWHWDLRSGVVEWDETIENLHGLLPGSFERTFEAFAKSLHPEDLPVVQTRISEALARGPEYDVEFRSIGRGGAYFWRRTQGQVIREGDKPIGMVGVVWDITPLKQEQMNQQFLLDLSAKLSQSSDAAQLAATAVDALGGYLGVSRCTYIEVDPAGKAGVTLADYFAEGLNANEMDALDIFAVPLHQEGVWRATLSVADRSPRTWQGREIALLRGVAERLWPVIENARLLRLTRERQEQFEHTFEQAAVGMAHVDLDGRWLRLNDKICQITGYPREELLALRFQDITHPDSLDPDVARFEALKRGEMRSYSIEKRIIHKSGSIVWVNRTVSLVRDDAGAPKYAIAVVEDITDRKQAL